MGSETDLESGVEREPSGGRRSIRSGSSSESERRRNYRSEGESVRSTRSLKEKRRKVKEVAPTSRGKLFAAAAAACAGTLFVLMLLGVLPLPMAVAGDGRPPDSSRVIHLVLAGNEARKARFGLSKSLSWDLFLSGVRDRLGIASIDRIETSNGVMIRAVEDLLHRDNLIVYEGEPIERSLPERAAPSHSRDARGGEMRWAGEGGPPAKASSRRSLNANPSGYVSKNIELWTVADVAAFFTELKLGQYLDAIRRHDVTGPMLLELEQDAEALKELGISSKLHISKIRSSLKSLEQSAR